MQLFQTYPPSRKAQFLFGDTRLASLWLILRLYLGWVWLVAGWEKVHNPAWVGAHAGTALQAYLQNALAKTAGPHPDVSSWYAFFIEHFALQHTALFSSLVAFGEVAVGVALILGVFVGFAAFFGAFMNLNYLLAGTVSINPHFLVLQFFLILAWRTAGWYGLDRFLLPFLAKKNSTEISPGLKSS